MSNSRKASDILIVGAGPAGATASIWLSHHQIPHIIIDKAGFPRDKICGDAISGRAFSILKQIQPNIMEEVAQLEEALVTYGVLFSAPSGRELGLDINRFAQVDPSKKASSTPGFVIKRQDFDNFLFQKLDGAYADIRQYTTLKHLTRLPNGQVEAVVKSSDGQEETVHPKIVIGADGERSIVNKQLAQHRNSDKHFAAAVRAYYTGVTGFDDRNSIELHFLKETIPGYLWIFPLPNGGSNVGMGMLSHYVKQGKRNLRQEMLDILETHPKFKGRFANAKLEGKVTGWGLPLGSKKRSISGDNYLLTGDAASLIDPLTGEGVGNAVISGKYAAVYAMEALEAENYSAAFFKQRYDHIIYKKLWKEFQMSHTLQRMGAYPALTNFVFKLATQNPKMQDAIAKMFVDVDLRKKFKDPFFYLKMIWSK